MTSYALLGQLALRPWSVYDMTKNVGRTLHWFWPRAESVLYAEVKRLVTLGLAARTSEPGLRGRDRGVYSLTDSGRAALAEWLAGADADAGGRGEPSIAFHCEPLVRVHLAPYGTQDDLLAALQQARDYATALLRQAVLIANEFLEGRHQFQDQVHIRSILFDYLWNHGLTMYLWAERSLERVDAWDGIGPADESVAAGLAVIAAAAMGSDVVPPAVELTDAGDD